MHQCEIKVYVGVGLYAAGIKDALSDSDEDGQENTLLFDVAHALLVKHQDARARIHEVNVESVTIDTTSPTPVEIEFTTLWSAYDGCRDMKRWMTNLQRSKQRIPPMAI